MGRPRVDLADTAGVTSLGRLWGCGGMGGPETLGNETQRRPAVEADHWQSRCQCQCQWSFRPPHLGHLVLAGVLRDPCAGVAAPRLPMHESTRKDHQPRDWPQRCRACSAVQAPGGLAHNTSKVPVPLSGKKEKKKEEKNPRSHGRMLTSAAGSKQWSRWRPGPSSILTSESSPG